jgi:cytochrome c-type biogenesis protein CcmH/NrfG
MAHFQLARSLKFQGKLPESLSSYRRAAALAPKDKDILLGLAKLLAAAGDVSLRNGPEAVRIASSVCRLTENKDPESLDVLAAAYAQAGKFELAVETSKKALELARAKGDKQLVGRISARLRLYKQSKTIPPGK